jgi:3-methyladenine DNA glycosylase Tag
MKERTMRPFEDLMERAAQRKGGASAVESLLPRIRSPRTLATIPDDRWLAGMTRAVFRAGFRWQVIESKWPGFEAAFNGFEPGPIAVYSDEDLDRLATDTRIVRQWRKIAATRRNARFVVDLAAEHGSAARFFARWPDDDFVGLLEVLKREAAWMGGTSAQYFLRDMGKDSFILSRDVVAALIRERIVDRQPGSRADFAAVQTAFNQWREQSGRCLAHISRVLALTAG